MKERRQTRDNGFIRLVTKKILKIEMLGKPNQEEENYVVLYEPRAPNPWDRKK
jgi:hypothetical protein